MVNSRRSWWISWLPFLLVCLVPVAVLFWQTFVPLGGHFTLELYRESWAQAKKWTLLANSVKVGVGVVATTLLFGLPMAWWIGRCDLRWRGFYAAAISVPLLIPPYVLGIAWTQIASIGGYWAIVGILSATYLPIMVWMAARGFRDVDGRQEDALRLTAGPVVTFCKITLPMARRSILGAALLIFVLAISDFSVSDFFSFAGSQEQSFQVFSNDVYFRWTSSPRPEAAVASAVPLVALAMFSVWLLALVEGKRSVVSMQGQSQRARQVKLSSIQRCLAHGTQLAILVLAAGVPLFVILGWATKGIDFAPSRVANAPAGGAEVAISTTTTLWSVLKSQVRGDMLRSLQYCGLASFIVVLLSLGPAYWLTRRHRGPLAMMVTLLPLAVPSVLLGMAQLRLFNRSWLDWMYTGGGLVIWTFVTRYLPIGIMGVRAVWSAVDPELEDAAKLTLPNPWQRFYRVIGPMIARGAIVTGLLCFGLAMRDLDTIVLLDGAQRTLPLRLYNKIHYARDSEVAVLCLLQLLAIFVPLMIGWLLLPRMRGHRATTTTQAP